MKSQYTIDRFQGIYMDKGEIRLSKKRKAVIVGFLLLLAMPFIFIQTIFPFYRFGMFAEPRNSSSLQETFIVTYFDRNGSHLITPDEAKVSRSQWTYLQRNYFHRGEGELFLEKLHQIKNDPAIVRWQLEMIATKDAVADTSQISWEPPSPSSIP